MWRCLLRRALRAWRRTRRSEVLGGTASLPASTVLGIRGKGGRVPSVISWWISRPSVVPSSAASHGCLPKIWSLWVQARTSRSSSSTRASNSSRVRAWESTVAAMAPAEVAVTTSGTMPSTPTRYCNTPTSKDPLVPPPARTNAVGPVPGDGGIRPILAPVRAPTKTVSGPGARAVLVHARGGSATGRRAHHLDQGAGAGRGAVPLRARHDAAVDRHRHALGVLLGQQGGDHVGDGRPRRPPRPARR